MFGSFEFRRQRTALFSGMLWKRRFVFVIGSVSVAVAAVLFAMAADKVSEAYHAWAGRWPYLQLVILPLAMAGCAWCTKKFFDGAQGSGIPQAIAARASRHHDFRKSLLNARIAFGKVTLTLVALLAGASVGREGPTVQIGASIMFMMAGYAGLGRERGLVLAGSAAGIAAAFNTPFAGVVFAIEEMAGSFERRINGLIIAAVVTAGVVSLAAFGNYHYFGTVEGALARPVDWLSIPICAVLGGVAGAIFSRFVIAASGTRSPLFKPLKRYPILFAAGCGLVVAVTALLTNNFSGGSGYNETRELLAGSASMPWWYAPAKLVATAVSSSSGIAGGLFSPSLAVGASFGPWVAKILPGVSFDAICMLTMVAYFAGVVQSPLTAFVIVYEMTNDSRMVMPLMATALLAAGVSRLFCREPLYHALSHNYSARLWKKSAAPHPAEPEQKEPEKEAEEGK